MATRWRCRAEGWAQAVDHSSSAALPTSIHSKGFRQVACKLWHASLPSRRAVPSCQHGARCAACFPPEPAKEARRLPVRHAGHDVLAHIRQDLFNALGLLRRLVRQARPGEARLTPGSGLRGGRQQSTADWGAQQLLSAPQHCSAACWRDTLMPGRQPVAGAAPRTGPALTEGSQAALGCGRASARCPPGSRR